MPLAESLVHTLDPFVVNFGNGFGVRWYGLAYAVGFLIGWLALRWLSATRRTPLTKAQVGDLVTALVIGVLLGGRLGHVLFYEPRLLFTFSSSIPFWEFLAIHKGGMSSHGGIIGVVLACMYSARRFRVPTLHLTDLTCLVSTPGLGLGRLANWVNGELWGKPLPASMQADPPWWSVKYPMEIVVDRNVSGSAELAARMPELLALSNPQPGETAAHAITRACYEGNAQVIDALAPVLTARYPSNFFQATTDGVIVLAVAIIVWLVPRKAGVVTGAVVASYGALRLVTEQFREPDPDILTLGYLTLPMLLSLAMIVVGIALAVFAARRAGPRFGGLLRRAADGAA